MWIDPTNPTKFDIRTDGIIMNVGYAFASGKENPSATGYGKSSMNMTPA
ncbi:hypothetical protein BL7055_10430 [Bifidobacterium longum subsp. longum]|nr:hypothetical protein [Bifidobacterium longum]QOL59166.1 hypothetical protein BL7055_10430 [Bifidobacterium longum subsp. longum]